MQSSNQDLDTIIKRIKKLLNLSKSSNEAEASLALERAQEMLVKYKLDMASVAGATLYKAEEIKEFNSTMHVSNLVWEAYAGTLMGSVAKNSFCRAFRWSSRSRNKFDTRICIIGKETDVEICKAQFGYIFSQIQDMANHFVDRDTDIASDDGDAVYQEGPRGRGASKQRNDFACGIAARVSERLAQLRKRLETGQDTQALVVVEDGKMKEALSRIRFVSAASYSPNQSAFSQGREAGNRVQLNRQVK